MPEEINSAVETNEQRNRSPLRFLRNAAIIGSLAMAGMAARWDSLEVSGDYLNYPPSVTVPVAIDNQFRIGSENTAGEAASLHGKIARWIRHYHLNYVLLQEVTTDDAAKLAKDFSKWDVDYVLADKREHYNEGGYGNLVMSQQIPQDIRTRSFSGTSTTDTAVRLFTAVPVDALNLDFGYTAWQEDRAAIAETTRVIDGNNEEDVRIVNGHISGNSLVHHSQLSAFTKFLDSNAKRGRVTVVCADFNGHKQEVSHALKRVGFITPTKHSTRNTNNGDFCGIYSGGRPAIMTVNMVTDFKTDHYPNVATVTFPAPSAEPVSVNGFERGTFK